jgi:hypothetical protein
VPARRGVQGRSRVGPVEHDGAERLLPEAAQQRVVGALRPRPDVFPHRGEPGEEVASGRGGDVAPRRDPAELAREARLRLATEEVPEEIERRGAMGRVPRQRHVAAAEHRGASRRSARQGRRAETPGREPLAREERHRERPLEPEDELAARHRVGQGRLLERGAPGVEVGRELGEQPERGQRAGVVEHVAAPARRPDERQDVAREPFVERALEPDLPRMRARDRDELVPRPGRITERLVIVDEGLPRDPVGEETEPVDRAGVDGGRVERGEERTEPGVVERRHVGGGERERVHVELDEIERPGPGRSLGGERAPDVGVLLGDHDDAFPARRLPLRDDRAVDGQLARQERDGDGQLARDRAARRREERGDQEDRARAQAEPPSPRASRRARRPGAAR